MNMVVEYGDRLVAAFAMTIKLTAYSGIGALLLGTLLAAMRVSPIAAARWIGAGYVHLVRNTPLTLIILFCSFGLYQTLGVRLASSESRTFIVDNNFRLSVLGLAVYTGAFVCESLRSGINTIGFGQAEAGRAIGLTFSQSLRIVILPQAFRAVIAPLGSVLIALTRNTTVVATIGVAEAAVLMKTMIENEAAIFLVGAIFAAGFVGLTLPTGLLFGYLSKRYRVAQ